jgi:hypothetical protein
VVFEFLVKNVLSWVEEEEEEEESDDTLRHYRHFLV